MRIQTWTRLLGLYLLLCAAYQAGIYFYPGLFPNPKNIDIKYYNDSWFYFGNPRVGFAALPGRFEVAYWASAGWLIGIAGAILAFPAKWFLLRVYIAAELAMALSSILWILESALLRSGFSGFGYSVFCDFELQTQAVVLVVFSLVPCVAAIVFLRDVKVALKLMATSMLSVLACPAGFLLAILFYKLLEIFKMHSGPRWGALAGAEIFPLIVFIAGVGWSFKGTKRSDASIENGRRD